MEEPLLHGNEIQGDSLAGFRKDFVSLLFLEFDGTRIADTKRWLKSLTLARLGTVHAFNTAFSLMRRQLQSDPPLHACWLNIGFTAQGLKKILAESEVAKLGVAFNLGAHGRSSFIGDPDNGAPGDPRTWVIGGPKKIPDAMLIIAADHETSVATEVRSIRKQLDDIAPGLSPIRVIYEQAGQTLRGEMKGHEHFGFKDGISQPGIRGRIDSPTQPLLTPRLIDTSDPLGETFSAPGQPLVWPGEFVKGYPEMDLDDPLKPVDKPVDPPWITDGTFLVFRRLYQDVAAFRRFVDYGVNKLTTEGFQAITPERFGAMCVGRWAPGTPIPRAPLVDDHRFAKDQNDANNSFFYDVDTVPVKWNPFTGRNPDVLPPARRDFDGATCPLAAHIRKVNPRDETTEEGDFPRALKHRIIRRGIPYGEQYDPLKPGSEHQDRGLLFIAYQSSIENQFEFLQRQWSNGPDTPRTGGGIDPIIGQNGNGPANGRTVQFIDENGRKVLLAIPERLVIATGGVYLFVPSVSAIQNVLAKVAE